MIQYAQYVQLIKNISDKVGLEQVASSPVFINILQRLDKESKKNLRLVSSTLKSGVDQLDPLFPIVKIELQDQLITEDIFDDAADDDSMTDDCDRMTVGLHSLKDDIGTKANEDSDSGSFQGNAILLHCSTSLTRSAFFYLTSKFLKLSV